LPFLFAKDEFLTFRRAYLLPEPRDVIGVREQCVTRISPQPDAERCKIVAVEGHSCGNLGYGRGRTLRLRSQSIQAAFGHNRGSVPSRIAHPRAWRDICTVSSDDVPEIVLQFEMWARLDRPSTACAFPCAPSAHVTACAIQRKRKRWCSLQLSLGS
jgi:hypothetical protein